MREQLFLLKRFVFVILICSALLNAENNTMAKMEIPLNHFFLVVNTETYQAIEGSEFLKTVFGVFEQRTTVRTDITYTGSYFYGTNTYFEFFDVKQKEKSRVGDTGIAFGTDQRGAIQSLQKNLDWSDPILITRNLEDQQVPWFWMISPKDSSADSGMSTWAMEYVPEFLQKWHSGIQDGQKGISRKAILSRYSNFLKQDPAKRLLKDVIGLTIAMDDTMKTKFAEYCRIAGYTIRAEKDSTTAEGPGITFRFIPQTESIRGIQRIDFSVNSTPDQRQHKFGTSVLTFEPGNRANWVIESLSH